MVKFLHRGWAGATGGGGKKMIAKPDQLFPLYVIQVLGDYKGFPGLFIAGIFSAGLSTVSTGLNSLAAIWFSELDGTKFKTSLSDKNAGLLVKLLSFLFGILSFALVFVVPYMGGLVSVAISLSSFFSGSLFGIFLLGMFVPASNTAGATAGLLAGVFLVGWLEVGANIAASQGLQVLNPLPTSIAGCSGNTTSILPTPRSQEAFVLYRISFLWYSLLSTLVTVIVGILVSFIANWWMDLKPNKSSVPSLITLPSMEPDKKKVLETKSENGLVLCSPPASTSPSNNE
uniref:Sodium-dependent multivitamin transporter n=1 Tax=Timema cristinae TaxID=61476 RepID=A0A7R9CEX8_TIMCR|nr:unnamed protein product [Timema cristinae]